MNVIVRFALWPGPAKIDANTTTPARKSSRRTGWGVRTLSERAVNHLVSAFGSSDLFWVFERQFGGPMWENVDEWLRMSPATYARAIETPLLVVHSENDLRCNVEQGEHLFTLLRLMGKEVEMLRFPAESHELSRSGSPVHRVQRFEAILEWFGRYLNPGN